MESIRSMRFNEAKGAQSDKRYNASKMVPVSARERAYNRGSNDSCFFSSLPSAFPDFCTRMYLVLCPGTNYLLLNRAILTKPLHSPSVYLTILTVYHPFPMFARSMLVFNELQK